MNDAASRRGGTSLNANHRHAAARELDPGGAKPKMADVLALVDDIFFQSKLAETARLAGVELKSSSTNEALLRAADENPGATILLDLNARSRPLDALAALRGSPAAPERRIIAFLSHVQTELAERARAAGCDEVMPRSKFTLELPRILREAKDK